MSTSRVEQVQRRLILIGWPIERDGVMGPQTRRAISRFQLGYLGPGAPLDVSGQLNRTTLDTIEWSVNNEGRCSVHFRFAEFASKGNGDILVHRALVRVLEKIRRELGRSVPIYSGHRDPYHNKRVGGAEFSQHLYGTGADILESLRVTVALATRCGATGIGIDGSSGFVRHVDVRHVGPNNTTGARVGHPTTWRYS